MMDETRRKAERIAREITAKEFGVTAEEVDAVIKKAQETVRSLSMKDVAEALGHALDTVLGYNSSLIIGPVILSIVIHELFEKQEGE